MRRQFTGTGAVAQRRRLRSKRLSSNRIFFPRELGEAILAGGETDLPTCGERDLELDSMTGRQSKTPRLGRQVQLNVVAESTGKLAGKFSQIDLSAETARALAQLLTQLAEK